VQVRYYQRLRDLAGVQAESHILERGARVSDALAAVFARHPGIAPFASSILVAVNNEYAEPKQGLDDGDVIDLMPPVSGG
jgi:MoaD family protein